MQVIFKFHANEKKIMFVGDIPFAEETAVKNLLENTKHVFLPEYL
jgi:2-phospho-L-lactate guanylyltransferase (CobY/MobA/RfbA family)